MARFRVRWEIDVDVDDEDTEQYDRHGENAAYVAAARQAFAMMRDPGSLATVMDVVAESGGRVVSVDCDYDAKGSAHVMRRRR